MIRLLGTLAIAGALLIAAAEPSDARRHRHRHAHRHAATFDQRFTFPAASPVIAEMRRYIGSNPTGWRRAWCGRMLDMALRRTGHAPGSALARAYASYGRPAAGPAPGVISVWRHHVGIVTAVPGHGHIVTISGNDGHRVRERVRSAAGVIAWRWPT